MTTNVQTPRPGRFWQISLGWLLVLSLLVALGGFVSSRYYPRVQYLNHYSGEAHDLTEQEILDLARLELSALRDALDSTAPYFSNAHPRVLNNFGEVFAYLSPKQIELLLGPSIPTTVAIDETSAGTHLQRSYDWVLPSTMNSPRRQVGINRPNGQQKNYEIIVLEKWEHDDYVPASSLEPSQETYGSFRTDERLVLAGGMGAGLAIGLLAWLFGRMILRNRMRP